MAGIGMGELLAIAVVVVLVVGAAAMLVASGRWSRSRAVWQAGGALGGALVMRLLATPLPGIEDSLSTAGGVRLITASGAVAGAFLGWAWRPLSDEEVRRWAARRDVDALGDGGLELLRRFVRHSRGWRTLAVAGLLPLGIYAGELGNALGGSGEPDAATAYAVGRWLGLPTMAVLYGIAALAVELRRRGRSHGRAVLSAREVHDYVNPFARGLQRLVLVLAVLAGGLWLVVGGSLEPAVVLPAVTAVLAGWAAVEIAQRRIVARDQRFDDPDLVVADDLARSSTAHALTGSLVGAGVPALAFVLGDVAMSLAGWPRNLLGVLAVVLSAASVGLWAGLGTSYASTVTRPVARDRDAEVVA